MKEVLQMGLHMCLYPEGTRNKTFYFWPHKVEMHFLEAIPVKDRLAEDIKQEAFEKIRDYYTAKNSNSN
jgi:1-acyl-sn-glycerol-3-phosphate acyltransferase